MLSKCCFHMKLHVSQKSKQERYSSGFITVVKLYELVHYCFDVNANSILKNKMQYFVLNLTHDRLVHNTV
jgi:hypothetical protein